MGKKSYFRFTILECDLEKVIEAWLTFEIGRRGWSLKAPKDREEGGITWDGADWLGEYTNDDRYKNRSPMGWPWDYTKLFIERGEQTITLGRHSEHHYIAEAIAASFRAFLKNEQIGFTEQ